MHLSLLPQQQKALEIRLIYLSLFLQLRKAFLLLTCINLHAKAKARLYEALFQRNLISATKLSADVFSYTFPLLNLHVVFALALHHRFLSLFRELIYFDVSQTGIDQFRKSFARLVWISHSMIISREKDFGYRSR